MQRAWIRTRRAFERVFDQLGGRAVAVRPGRASGASSASASRPACDVLESDHEVMVVCDVPGATRESADVCVDGEALEIALGPRWYAHIRLPATVRADGARATLRKGVLTLYLPKSSAAPAASLRRTSA